MLLLPAWRAQAGRVPFRSDEVETIDDAVQLCQRTDLSGWELVAYAQRLVHRKFACYSCRNLWDTPAQAFRYGMGYCTQYNLALKQLLERLGVSAHAVTSFKVRVADDPTWSMGHTWLRVTVQARHAMCAPVTPTTCPVRSTLHRLRRSGGQHAAFFLLHLGMIPFCGYLEWRSLLTQHPLPDWMFQHRRTC